jgi:hypothetical protein
MIRTRCSRFRYGAMARRWMIALQATLQARDAQNIAIALSEI